MGYQFEAMLLTPEVQRFRDVVVEWIKNDMPGGCTFGRQRLGKTLACELLPDLLPEALGRRIAVMQFTIPARTKSSERALLSQLLQQCRYEFALSKDTSRLETNLLDLMDQACADADATDLVLIIDEAHNLEELGFQLLVHLHNLLAHRRRRVFTLVNGQLELDARRKAFLDAGKLEIIGRFFPRTWQFHGLSLDDLGAVLTALDAPDDNGSSVTSRLSPKACEKGWHLAPAAGPIVKAIRDIAQRSKIDGEPMVPMQNLVSLVLILAAKAEAGEGLNGFDASTVVDGLDKCGYVDIMALHARTK